MGVLVQQARLAALYAGEQLNPLQGSTHCAVQRCMLYSAPAWMDSARQPPGPDYDTLQCAGFTSCQLYLSQLHSSIPCYEQAQQGFTCRNPQPLMPQQARLFRCSTLTGGWVTADQRQSYPHFSKNTPIF